jgi:hypothetical protein
MADYTRSADWERSLSSLLPLFGHRNWIVVADWAYPAQSSPGVFTICANADQMHVVKKVSGAITAGKHVRANVYLDQELAFVAETDAPGITAYRDELTALLGETAIARLPHEQIIARLDQAAETFRVLVIKTDMTIPYTSVFFELDCGYWDAGAEERLRGAMLSADPK